MSADDDHAVAPSPTRFDGHLGAPSALRAAIASAKLVPETECVPPLIEAATLPPDAAERVRATARRLVIAIRARPRSQGIDGLIHEYSLSSEEGVSLMCLAEALLRIPDNATRDALIRDKVARGDWLAHVSSDNSLFVNAATWGLAVTGRIIDPIDQRGLASALGKLLARGGEPVVRRGVDLAMRLMGEQFVTGQTIGEALANSRRLWSRGYSHSYDMLGEAATTAADAARYLASYERAIHAIGAAAAKAGPYGGPGISIKLSALHPRYRRSQIDRVLNELLPRLRDLAVLAKSYDIGLNIDAEEADRLELSLDLLEALAFDPALVGWNGLGFVVQGYGKRCPAVIDFIIDLARRSGRRLMVRLVKGAYWDAEIKQAQLDGLADFPVYTRKIHTDIAYIACARKLLAARDAVFPQFATHNAQTLATILELAGPHFAVGDYEFQCLHGMGEPLYDEVVGPKKLNRPCRIYAPVGAHDTLLAYLVRRLLENGANSSFVNRIADESVSIDDLVADPVMLARRISPPGAPHPAIRLPRDILGERRNSAGLDLSDDGVLLQLAHVLAGPDRTGGAVRPLLAGASADGAATALTMRNPADQRDEAASVIFATPADIAAAFEGARVGAPGWAATPAANRAELLERAADLMQADLLVLVARMVREAGKTVANGIGEVREAVDFLRYYAAEARKLGMDARPLGIVVCISPWNFPLSIFTGQVAAALAAGNAVIAKPAEETPLVAAAAVDILHRAGIGRGVLQFLPGAGDVGAAIVANPDTAGVVFTGSTEVARLIATTLAERLSPGGQPIPLIAETAGQNAMIVDSSALTEQVVGDALASAFDSAGQRCSALRILCLQDDIADRTLAMLKGAMAELCVGNPNRLATDVGPVITAEARDRVTAHIEAMRNRGRRVTQAPLAPETADGIFVPPTIIELSSLDELQHEVFGPVLHVVRFARANLEATVSAINRLGYGLTFGLQTRLDETVERVTAQVEVGNIYVNRNIIGAVVGVQPFGGHRLSGTGPKAGGPLYLRRLVAAAAPAGWVWPGFRAVLAGPVGESNTYSLAPRGRILAVATTASGLGAQLAAIRATGNAALVMADDAVFAAAGVGTVRAASWSAVRDIAGVLVEGSDDAVLAAARATARLPGPLVPVQASSRGIDPGLLLSETSLSINTAAAGGNATLMALGTGE